MSEKRVTDWESIERDYRAGLLSVREIAATHGISHTAIAKRAKAEGWDRDLRAKILAKADAKVAAAIVTPEQAAESQAKASDAQLIEFNANAVAAIKIRHRTLAKRGLNQCEKLLMFLEAKAIADDDAKDFAGVLKQLADAQKSLIAGEREAWGMANIPDAPPKQAEVDPMEGARRLAFILAQANAQLQRTPTHG
jgi:hypothetical protein